eukprot:4227699-Prymnesium_polylepis.1
MPSIGLTVGSVTNGSAESPVTREAYSGRQVPGWAVSLAIEVSRGRDRPPITLAQPWWGGVGVE